ncbi:MAG: serine/threonine-protein kinase [Planctomycetota bacterium]|nr:serine/threonine-protein kinase [Planctomycetota bacterium]
MSDMDDSRRERLKESLLVLEGLSPEQQRAWIAERLRDDPELAREATRLVGSPADARLSPLVQAPPSLSLSSLLPERIGPFVVEGMIAQGGMGCVYRAFQEVPVRRRAAVKVLRPELTSPQSLERFEDERQVVARMEHRNVARLLDAGWSSDGQAYIAMELIDGPPITEYVRLHGLPISKRLELFVQVCRGVQHAHARGVLHRDLKPSNVLVADEDASPVPKVIDFGVAKLLMPDKRPVNRQTQAGQLLGTVGYMSPEQADPRGGDVDVRSDVFSLGVLLYEVVTGVRPFDDESLCRLPPVQAHQAMTTRRAVPPSTRLTKDGQRRDGQQQFPPDLDCVILKAIEPEPDGRYATVGDFARDVESVLRGNVIAARPPTTRYVVGKFVRRHRVPVVSGLLIVAALLIGLIAAGLALRQALIDRGRAQSSLVLAEEEKSRADAALARSEEVATYLRNLLMQAHPSRLGPKSTFSDILNTAADDFLKEPPRDLLVRAEVANAIAEPLYLIGGFDDVEQVLLPRVEELGSSEDPRSKKLRATMMVRLGYVASRKNQPDEAERRFVRARELAAVSGSPELEYQSKGALAQTLTASGRYDEAIAMLHELVQSEVAQKDELLKASALSNLGVAYGRKGAFIEGLPYSRESYEIRLRRTPHDPATYSMGWQLGISLMENRQFNDSVLVLEQTQAAATAGIGENHPDVVSGVVLLNYARARRGDGAVVIAPIRASIEKQRTLGIPPAILAQSRMYLSGALLNVGDREASIAEADSTLAELATTFTPCDQRVVRVLLQVGSMFSAGGAAPESLPYLLRAYECSQTDAGSAPLAARIAGAIEWSYRRMDDAENAELWKQKRTSPPAGDPGVP